MIKKIAANCKIIDPRTYKEFLDVIRPYASDVLMWEEKDFDDLWDISNVKVAMWAKTAIEFLEIDCNFKCTNIFLVRQDVGDEVYFVAVPIIAE